ncbi:dTMP kinase [Mumia sp. zg.B17]|uniref:dTMP kinase n=3 Tax=unclassified Mumia TaxID=2621872 RepID=UPI0027E3409C|nr:dTMP kinase [Mumia sp. zg.B17]
MAYDPAGTAADDDANGIRLVMRIPVFRRFWAALGLASLADWIGLLAITAFANSIGEGYAGKNFAIAAVLFARLAPALVIGPFGGYVADRMDRRITLTTGLFLRAGIFASIPLVGTLWWLIVATVLIEAVNAVWMPTKDATVPTLVPREHLEDANRLNLATTYGSALPAAVLFIVVTGITKAVDGLFAISVPDVDPALYLVAVLFALGGLVFLGARDIPEGAAVDQQVGVWRTIADGWAYVFRTPLVRGLVLGIVGAFGCGGVVIGLGRVFVGDLGAGDPGYGTLFGAVFLGLGLGMWRGPKVLPQVSRRRMFGVALVGAGVGLLVVAIVHNMALVAILVMLVGFCAGIAWITGYTLLGLEVDEEMRGRTFAFVQSLVRLVLSAVLAIAPLVAGLIGTHTIALRDLGDYTYTGTQIAILVAAVLATGFGLISFRQMNDRHGLSLISELKQDPSTAPSYSTSGLFIAFEGGEGAGKSTQAWMLAEALRADGYRVLLTREPGATPVGQTVREILLDPATGELSPRTEMLLYAADKAEHLEQVVNPALARGDIVITDRYVDSTLAYQAGGRGLDLHEVESVARWATSRLRPHLTVLLDVDPELGRSRFDQADRLEAEPTEFHVRVRETFLQLASKNRDHYMVLRADRDIVDIADVVLERVQPLLGHVERAIAPMRPPPHGSPFESRAQTDGADSAAEASRVDPVDPVDLEERVETIDEAFTPYDTVSEGGDPSYADADEIRADDRGGQR